MKSVYLWTGIDVDGQITADCFRILLSESGEAGSFRILRSIKLS